VGIFAMGTRRPTDRPEARVELPGAQRQGVPPHFEAVGEALASGSGSKDACAVAGGDLARDGVSLEEVLDGLAVTARLVRGRDPDLAETRAVAIAWADAMLSYVHQLSCEDPLTGLASLAHVRGRLADLYRGEVHEQVPARESHALVVLEAPQHRGRDEGWWMDELGHGLQLGRLGATARTVFSGSETIGRVGRTRVAVIARRDGLGPRLALLRELLAEAGPSVRVWIEGLPGSDAAAAQLLDELARS
jgi:hypothetical protein